MRLISRTLCLTAIVALVGCSGSSSPSKAPVTPPKASTSNPPAGDSATAKANDKAAEAEAKIKANLAKLSGEDRALAEAQEWCVETDDRLGEMGVPVKILVKEKPVFLCCDGCEKKAQENPDKTLAKVEELKAKKKAAVEKK